MTLSEARKVFAAAMQAARDKRPYSKARLTQARQVLRRAARPAMNAKKKGSYAPYGIGDPSNQFWVHAGSYTAAFHTLDEAINYARRYYPFSSTKIRNREGVVVWKRDITGKENPIELGYRSKKTGRGAHVSIGVGRSRANPGTGKFLVTGKTERGNRVYYTGRSGQSFVSLSSRDAFRYETETAAYNKVSTLNRMSRVHGIEFEVLAENSDRNRPRRNPAGSMQRLGRALEVRYQRTIGERPGYYKHNIKSPRAGLYTIGSGWVYVPGRSILITEGKPRV